MLNQAPHSIKTPVNSKQISSTPEFRPGTNDEYVWRSVAEGNEYFVPDTLKSTDIVVDVGMHIGSFSYLALTRGAGKVYAYEADAENFQIGFRHLAHFKPRIEMENLAVCRSDDPPPYLYFSGYRRINENILNTGGGNVLWAKEGSPIPTIAFDEILERASERGRRRIRLLKLDCEGSEYPLLMTSKCLERIDEIVGEFHEIGCGADIRQVPKAAHIEGHNTLGGSVLSTFLREQGFDVRIGGRNYIYGKFFASR
jgi:FkbM family methyltransferase